MEPDATSLSSWIGIAAALGTAAMGLVEAFKWTPIGVIGLQQAKNTLGAAALEALDAAYGAKSSELMLQGAYRRGPAEFGEFLRNGIKVGAAASDARGLANDFGVDPALLEAVVAKARGGGAAPTDEEAMLLGRFHLAVDARVDGAVAVSTQTYDSQIRLLAGGVALVGTVIGLFTSVGFPTWSQLGMALIIAGVAVPLAPASKEVLNFLTAVRKVVFAPKS